MVSMVASNNMRNPNILKQEKPQDSMSDLEQAGNFSGLAF